MNNLKIAWLVGCLSIFLFNTDVNAKDIIAYSHVTDGYWQIWTMSPDGSQKKQITHSKFDKRDPVWMNESIVYRTHNGEAYVFDLKNNQEQQILEKYNRLHNIDYSSTDNTFMFVRFDPRTKDVSHLWISDNKGDSAEIITQGGGLKYQPRFSPDGSKVVFVKAEADEFNLNIWLLNRETSELEQLTDGKGMNMLPVFAPDGKSIVFSSNRGGNGYDLYSMNLTNKKITRLTDDPGLDTSPDFSKDGKKLAFVTTRSGNRQVWIMSLTDNNHAVQITDGDNESMDPAWTDIDF